MECLERMKEYLSDNNVPFEIMTHTQAFTMPEVAAALHVPGEQVAKVVMAKGDGSMAMLVTSAAHRLDIPKVRDLLGADKVALAKEDEFADLFPDCEVGAMPPFGNLYNVPVYVDQALAEQASIVFRVGTHQQTMKVAYADYARLVGPMVGEFVQHL
jgi:Ala-tRNA(Pro) deacylase